MISGSSTIHSMSMIAKVITKMLAKERYSLLSVSCLLRLVSWFFPYWIRDVVTSSLKWPSTLLFNSLMTESASVDAAYLILSSGVVEPVTTFVSDEVLVFKNPSIWTEGVPREGQMVFRCVPRWTEQGPKWFGPPRPETGAWGTQSFFSGLSPGASTVSAGSSPGTPS